MKIISFNVNGVRAAVKKGLVDTLHSLDADIYCLQETKAQPDQVKEALEELQGYHIYAHSAERKGYSSTAILSKEEPVRLDNGLPANMEVGLAEDDNEGRVMTATFGDFILVNAYVPNSGQGLKRLGYRKQWDAAMLAHINGLQAGKRPVIYCGDLNVCHQEIDIARPKPNYNKSAGYTQVEIDGIAAYLENGLVDSFRRMYPEVVKYSWWSLRAGARQKNIGWRLDYVLISEGFYPKVKDSFILNDVLGSDHCPVGIEW